MSLRVESLRQQAPAYASLYERSLREPETFWKETAEVLSWERFPQKIRHFEIHPPDVTIRWFVVGYPHPVKGEGIYAFVVLHKEAEPPAEAELIETVRQQIGPIAKPDVIQIAPDLPKTRSGKIMRRILRKIVSGERDFGDVSTLAEPGVVEALWQGRRPMPV